MLTHFLRAVLIQGRLFNVLREEREGRDPTGEVEEALIPPRGKQVFAAEINGRNYYLQQIRENSIFFKFPK
ncbi:hypothetical protein ABE67_10040 [Cytobacillus firmus]|nr:hypothetical protein [Cytobacillus firmus]MBG9449645.1 hypothetical protein [Cytobacillus firmus]